MKIIDFVKKNYLIILIIFFALIIHLCFFFDLHKILWDSAVYIGMGKFIFSFGKFGLWEPIRPLVWPVILGFIWKSSLPIMIFGKIIQFLMYLFSITLIYAIGKKIYSKTAGLIAASFLASSSILLYFSFHLYTEIPAMFFVLLAYYLFLRKKYFLTGLFSSIAFLTKFPAGIFLAILFLFLLYKKQWKNLLFFGIGMAVVLIPFILTNLFFYQNLFGGLFAAQIVIKKVLGCNVLRPQPWYYYFVVLLFLENKFLLASVLCVFHKFKKNFLIFLSAILPLLYFINLPCKDHRYIILFLPFIALLSGAGLDLLVKNLKNKKLQTVFLIVLIAAISFVGYKNAFSFYEDNNLPVSVEEHEYFSYLRNISVQGEVWTSNPVLSAYSDNLLHKIYYPVYDEVISAKFFHQLQKYNDNIEFVFLDNCGGGIICHPEDIVCKEKNDEIIRFLDNNFKKVFDKKKGRCWYKIYRNPIF